MSANCGKEDPMKTLCKLVIQTGFEDLPQKVIDFAKRLILDTTGVILGGSSREGVSTIVEFVKEQGGKGESYIPVYGGERVPASMAAFATGVMARALDMGCVHEESIHSAEYTLPVLLASLGLKEKVTGKEFLTAFVLGEEVMIRIGIASRLVASGMSHLTDAGHYIFGSVAAVGKVIGLELDQLQNAEGIVSSMTQPHSNSMYYPPTLMPRVHHGFVAQDSINACLLAQRDITGPTENVLTGPSGYLSLLIKWETAPELITRELGSWWEMTGTTMKPYASCKRSHAATSGILDQMNRHNFGFDEISAIYIDEPPGDYAVVAQPYDEKWNPENETDCQFSLPYVVATAVRDGTVFVDSYTETARSRKDVRELMTRIAAKADPNLPPWSARVITRLRDGREYAGEYLHVKGHPKNPFSDGELIDKFRKCAAYSAVPFSENTITELTERILNIEQIEDVERDLIFPIVKSVGEE